jgi:tetratricopeptide (TPR) repeat protein
MKALSIAGAILATATLILGSRTARANSAMPIAQSPEQQSIASQSSGSEQTDAAIANYKRELATRPKWTEGWWNLGALEYSANHYDQAKSALLKVTAAAPKVGDAWALLGLSEFETKDYTNALQHLERADSLHNVSDPDIQRVFAYHLALLRIRNGEFERASTLLTNTFGKDGNSAQVTFALGLALLRVPLLPDQVDPSKEALIAEAGTLASGDDHALATFPAFIQAHPTTPYAHFAYGLALERAGRNRQALTEFHSETSVSPSSPLPWREISQLELRLGNTKASQAAAAKEAAINSTYNTKPGTSQASLYANTTSPAPAPTANDELWNRAMQEYGAAQYAPAIADLKTFLAQHSDNGTAWAVLGLSEFALGDNSSALLHLQRGATLGLRGNPQSLQTARYTTGILLLQAGQFDQASEVLEAAARAFPDDQKVRNALGLCLLRRAEFPDQSKLPPALINTGGKIAALLGDSKYDEAFALFKPLVAQYPSTPFVHYAYGTALMALSEFDEAAAQMKAEASISPTSDLPWLSLASIALRQHRPADALAPATKALTLSPNSPDAHYLLGRAALETGDDAKAVLELQQAAKLDPDSPEIHFNLARAYSRAKMTDAAAAERATFVRLNALAESEKSQNGSQIYTGPRNANLAVTPVAPEPSPKPN